jgi:hypothetical protein
MRKIIVGAQVSMDGVMQAPGAPTEDPTKSFKFCAWAMPAIHASRHIVGQWRYAERHDHRGRSIEGTPRQSRGTDRPAR